MTENPLHVRVAEALGWTPADPERGWELDAAKKDGSHPGWYFGHPPEWSDAAKLECQMAVYRYDTDRAHAARLLDLLDERGWLVCLNGGGDSWAMWCSKGDVNCLTLDDWPDGWPEDEPSTWQHALCYMVLLLAKEGLL